jgi:type IV secretory pathway TrbD component
MERDEQPLPPFRSGDRYDLGGLAAGAALCAILLVVGANVWLALGFGAGIANISAFALRRRAGVPQATVWQRARRRRR